ncbi:MAG: hypothetical protein IKN42_01970 [Elusimicrobia bacterium]|nr:hypothetical protein [Elusimicrobiota bacterium]
MTKERYSEQFFLIYSNEEEEKKFQKELQEYIEKFFVSDEDIKSIIQVNEDKNIKHLSYEESSQELTLDQFIKKELKNFNDILRKHIRNYNKKNNTKDSDIYTKADITKEHFNKIINNKIKPQKKPLIALGIALDLNIEEINELLHAAEFNLTNTSEFDLTIKFCLNKNIRNIHDINIILYKKFKETLTNSKRYQK